MLVYVFLYVPSATVLALEDVAELRLPVEEFPLIPGDAGMRFFEGAWRPLAGDSYVITKSVTVTGKTISWDDINEIRPHRVLAAQGNYVLLAWYDRMGVTEYVY